VLAIAEILAVNACVLVAVFLVLWLVCVRIKDVTVIDSFWAFGMVIMAGSTWLQSHGDPARKALILGLAALWGLRLGGYLTWRWRDHGPDRRYRSLLGKAQAERGWSFAKASLLLVFATQAPLLFTVSLPAQLGQLAASPAGLGPLAFAGAGLSVFGVLFESLGDWQLTRFRKDPANQGKVLDTGLWRYTRHPNYFGDACAWWGIYLVAAETVPGLWALPGPLLLTWTLMKWSGAPILESRLRRTRPDYVDYIRRTSGFVPWPPKAAI
jgi:steroid 5-alpha reductase family enzyme